MTSQNLRTRYIRILTYFAGAIIRFLYWELLLRHCGLRGLVQRTRSDRFRGEALRFRKLAIRLGGVMIKVGQFLSSRLDVLPAEITDTLADLQDEVPAEKFEDIRKLAESDLGASFDEKFDWFDSVPLAAASLGQVHRARLRDNAGEPFSDVVVKIQRPNINSIVEVDLSALKRVGNWLMRYQPVRDHADVPALMREFSSTILDEINYLREAENAGIFFSNFKDDRKVVVPRVVANLTTRRVLTLENVYSIKITDYEEITRSGIDRGAVARKLLDTYLEQIFEDGFFHADPHPGNLFVTPLPSRTGGNEKPVKWALTFVDFGMVGRVPDNLKASLRETLMGVGLRDSARLIKSYKSLGIILPGSDTVSLEKASAAMFDRFWGMSMSELRNISLSELHEIGHRMRDVMVEMPFQIPNELLLLGRTVAILSGMCTGLDPNFNLWKQLEPYARKLISEEVTTSQTIDSVLDQLGDFIKLIVAIPSQASRLLTEMERGGFTVQAPSLLLGVERLRVSLDVLTGAILFAAMLLGGILLINSDKEMVGNVLLITAGVLLILLVFQRIFFIKH